MEGGGGQADRVGWGQMGSDRVGDEWKEGARERRGKGTKRKEERPYHDRRTVPNSTHYIHGRDNDRQQH